MRWVMGMKYMWRFFQVAEVYAVSSTTPSISKSPEDCVPGEPKRRPNRNHGPFLLTRLAVAAPD
jgi:hypothetical protein